MAKDKNSADDIDELIQILNYLYEKLDEVKDHIKQTTKYVKTYRKCSEELCDPAIQMDIYTELYHYEDMLEYEKNLFDEIQLDIFTLIEKIHNKGVEIEIDEYDDYDFDC